MKNTWIALTCAISFTALGQTGSSYLGPGVLSRGSGDIGMRSGQQVDLRFYFDITGIYDTGIQPFQLDPKGNLIQINGLYGVQADLGAYGTHHWRQSSLGLDYVGNFYHYTNDSALDGSTHNLSVGFTYQESRRLIFDLRLIAGTSAVGFGTPGFYGGFQTDGSSDVVNTPTSLLFDSRIYYGEPTADVSYILTPRTIFTFGGDGVFIHRVATGLASTTGYNLHGTIRHRLSKAKSIAVTYEHIHYDYPPSFGQSDLNTGEFSFSGSLGRRWTISAGAGIIQTEIQGVQQVTLDPVVAALLGISFGQQAFYRADLYPSFRLSLAANFRRSTLSFSGSQSVVPGNGVYLTSRQQQGSIGYSFTGIRKWNLGLSAGYANLNGIGQGIQNYSGFSGGAGITYSLTRAIHIIARADSRYQQIDVVGYKRTGYRATIGLAFSPGNIPLSLW